MPGRDKERTGRAILIAGQFVNCRHHSSPGPNSRTFFCSKQQAQKTTCEGCFTCPKCDSMLFSARLILSFSREQVYADHAKNCVICGTFIEESLSAPYRREKEVKPEGICQVHGCMHTAYEGFQTTEQVDGQTVSFEICESHRRRIKTWRHHPTKGAEQKPVIFERGELRDNPKYKQQGKRRGTP